MTTGGALTVAPVVGLIVAFLATRALDDTIPTVRPEAAAGGTIGLVEEGDTINIDILSGKLTLEVDEAQLARRKTAWTRPPSKAVPGSYLERYSRLVTSAMTGAVFSRE